MSKGVSNGVGEGANASARDQAVSAALSRNAPAPPDAAHHPGTAFGQRLGRAGASLR